MIAFTGCANKVATYSVGTQNVLSLRTISDQDGKINLAKFTDDGREEASLMCRLATPTGTPDGETFASYIGKAFQQELVVANAYDPSSKITISGNLNRIYGSTTMGNAYWEFDMTISSTNGKQYSVKSRYDYGSSLLAVSACSEMQRSFVPAVQKLIGEIITNSKFKTLLQ
jgi:hypothetical protein